MRVLFITTLGWLATIIAFPYIGLALTQENLLDEVVLYKRLDSVSPRNYWPASKDVPALHHRRISNSLPLYLPRHLRGRTLRQRTARSASLEKRAISVEVWRGLGDGTLNMPTFKRTLSVAFKVPNPADIIAYAEEGYQNMMTQSYHKGFHTYLMAALYVPQKGVYLCSLPDGPALALIKNTGAAQAPALWSQIRSREPSLKIHAEDCAAYLYESSLTTKLAPGARYPAGSYIAVHGWYEALTGVNKDKGRPVGLCTSAAKHPVNPTCTAVFRALGVASDAPAAAPAGPGPHGPTGPVGPVGPVGNEGPSG